MTDRTAITDPTFSGWQACAPAGDLSPRSATSVSWDDKWPIKPEIVMEGGNYGIDPSSRNLDKVDDLSLMTTDHRTTQNLLTTSRDTSAATALASRMAAQIMAAQPDLWPETVRALMVHSARWTPAMAAKFPNGAKGNGKRLMLRRYGYGIPDLDRALASANNDATLVFQGDFQPFSGEKFQDMLLHELPWPVRELSRLADEQVELQVTLSYFIEPNPGERGWGHTHRYASHGLRFKVKTGTETEEEFRKRINVQEREDDDARVSKSDSSGWRLGSNARDKGSVHSDTWTGNGAELASKGAIAIVPVVGWWRTKKHLERDQNRVRYALVVTVRTASDVDLYTEIKNAVRVQSTVEVSV